MSEDPFLCPDCGHDEVCVADSLVKLAPLFRMQCNHCGRQWCVRAAKEDFRRD